MEHRICILSLIGLPGAGKSSFSQWLLSISTTTTFNVIHLCYDDFLHYRPDLESAAYKMQRSNLLDLLETLVESLTTGNGIPSSLKNRIQHILMADKRDVLIIADDNNYYVSMRYKLYQFSRRLRLSYAQIFMSCSLSNALQGNDERPPGVKVPKHVLEQMSERLEQPNPQQHSWEANTLTLHVPLPNSFFPDLVMPFLLQSFERIPKALEEKLKSPSAQSIVHQIDLELRGRIKQTLGAAPCPEGKQQKAKMLNDKRKKILTELRDNRVDAFNFDDPAKIIEYVDSLWQ